jgi:hypothetical protein
MYLLTVSSLDENVRAIRRQAGHVNLKRAVTHVRHRHTSDAEASMQYGQ